MKRFICAALLILAGCSTVPNVTTHVQPVDPALKANGGHFSATFTGNFTLATCVPPDGQGRFTFEGFGSGSFIHGATERGSMNGDVFTGCPWSGSATMQSTRHSQNSITMSLSLEKGILHADNPCAAGGQRPVMFTVSSGKGRFVNAAGSGTVAFTCHSDGTFTDQWTGTITF